MTVAGYKESPTWLDVGECSHAVERTTCCCGPRYGMEHVQDYDTSEDDPISYHDRKRPKCSAATTVRHSKNESAYAKPSVGCTDRSGAACIDARTLPRFKDICTKSAFCQMIATPLRAQA